MAEDAEEIPGRPVFGVERRVRVLVATAPGSFPRIATGCGMAIVKAYNPHTRECTAEALALYSRLQIKIPEGAMAAPSCNGLEEMISRGCARSCEGAKAAGEAKRPAAGLEKQVGQFFGSDVAHRKKARVTAGKVAASEANAAAAAAESPSLLSVEKCAKTLV
jgi:hypothetical protein